MYRIRNLYILRLEQYRAIKRNCPDKAECMGENGMKKYITAIILAAAMFSTVGYAAGEDVLTGISMGAERDEIYAAAGMPDTVSAGGAKETYVLSGGGMAVLHYLDDVLINGYIIR